MSKMLIDRALLEKALEALAFSCPAPLLMNKHDAAETAIRAALEQEEQEPVAIKDDDGLTLKAGWDDLPVGTPLYTAPPRREWQGLTHPEQDPAMKIAKLKELGEKVHRLIRRAQGGK
jgi:hypothetical protein